MTLTEYHFYVPTYRRALFRHCLGTRTGYGTVNWRYRLRYRQDNLVLGRLTLLSVRAELILDYIISPPGLIPNYIISPEITIAIYYCQPW